MKCPHCRAELMPVQNELFCLQCGQVFTLEEVAQAEAAAAATPAVPVVVVDSTVSEPSMEAAPSAVAAPTEDPAPTPVKRLDAPVHVAVDAGSVHRRVVWPDLSSLPEDKSVHRAPWRVVAMGLVVVGGLLVLANVGLGLWFQGRLLPGSKVGDQAAGGQSYTEAAISLAQTTAGQSLQLVVDNKHFSYSAADAGITVDVAATVQRLQNQARAEALPLLRWARASASPLTPIYHLDEGKLNAISSQIVRLNSHPATDAAIVVSGATPFVLPEHHGLGIDQNAVKSALLTAAQQHKIIVVNTTKIEPKVRSHQFDGELQAFAAKTALALPITIGTRNVTPTPIDIAGWLKVTGPGKGVAVDPDRVAAYIVTIAGNSRLDQVALASAVVTAAQTNRAGPIAANTKRSTKAQPHVVTQPSTDYHYCLAADGVSSDLAPVAAKLAEAYMAQGGWNLGGQIQWTAAQRDCNLTVWFAPSSAMSGFDPACRAMYSCQRGNDIILNADRWEGSAPIWPKGLDNYRTEVINHESGHWLGFDHWDCGQSGQPAPVIQGQTLMVAGCAPQWWQLPVDTLGNMILQGL